MGRHGPPPKPRALRLLDGDRKDRINNDEPIPRSQLPEMPEWLAEDDLAVSEWNHAVAEATFMRVLTSADGRALALYCSAIANAIRAGKAVVKLGPVLRNKGGYVVTNPAIRIQRDSAAQASRLLQQFGFTPASRVSLHAQRPEQSDAREALLS